MNCRGTAGGVGSEQKAEGKAPQNHTHTEYYFGHRECPLVDLSLSREERLSLGSLYPGSSERCARQGENLRLLRVRVFLDVAPDFPNEDRDLFPLHAAQDLPSMETEAAR